METIINYLENIFSPLPQTPEVLKMKEELALHMEEKYNELIADGKSNNEAIGIVIAEFGNIEELTSELNISTTHEIPEDNGPVVSREMAEEFINIKVKMTRFIAFGVFLCIFGTATFMFLGRISEYLPNLNEDTMEFIGLSLFLIFVAFAVAIFIYTDSKLTPYKYLGEQISLSDKTKTYLENRSSQNSITKTIKIIVGVIICILSPLIFIGIGLFDETYAGLAMSLLLLLISIAVVLFITSNSINEATDILLKRNNHTQKQKKSERIIGIIASIWWPLATIIFLSWSFITNDWDKSWIIWPISGILFGGISAAISIIFDK